MKRNVIILFIVLLGISWGTALNEAVSNPKELKEHLDRADELEKKGIYVDAVTEYESALAYDPENTEIRLKMAQAYLKSDDSRNFVSICEDVAEEDQKDTEALDILMDYYIENDYEETAVQYLDDFIQSYPENKNAQEWFLKLKGSYTELYCYYTTMSGFVNNTMTVSDQEKYGIADTKGKEIIPTEYKAAAPFSEEGFALVQKEDNEWIYIDDEGQTRKVPDKTYEDLGMFSEERVSASKNGLFGYLNENMEPVGEFKWDQLTGIKHGTGAAKSDGKWMLINEDGEEKDDKKYDGIVVDENGFCSGQKRIFVKTGEEYRIINTKGKTIGNLSFEMAKAFSEEGCAAVCKDEKWGYADSDGKLVIDYQYEDADSFQNGYAAVCKEGKWGYIDSDGNLVIDFTFEEATPFSSDGTAAVKINVQGEEQWKLIQLNLFR